MKENSGALGVDNFYLSKIYEDGIEENIKKANGIYYTPKVIVDYIMKKTLKQHNIVRKSISENTRHFMWMRKFFIRSV